MADDDLRERIALAIEAEARRQAAAVHADADEAWDAANLVAGLELAAGIARETPAWFAVADRLPEACVEVLTFSASRDLAFWVHDFRTGWHEGGVWFSAGDGSEARWEPTHWMPLSPPAEGPDHGR